MDWTFRHTARPAARLCLMLASLALCAAPAATQTAQGAGVIEGRVVDSTTGNALAGALVFVTETSAQTTTDREGAFRLAGVPAGSHTVVVTYLGRQDETV